MSENGHKPWGQILEVNMVADGPKSGRWKDLYYELKLRLEQTPRSKWLAVPFDDEAVAWMARHGMMQAFRKHQGHGYINTSLKANGDGGAVLYVRRGENYK